MKNEPIKAQHEAIREHDKQRDAKELKNTPPCSEDINLEQWLYFNTNASTEEIEKLKEDIKTCSKLAQKLKVSLERKDRNDKSN